MKRRLKNCHFICVVVWAMLATGCTNVSQFSLDNEFDSSPVKSKTKLTSALQCIGKQLENNSENPGAYVFMVRDIIDGTVNKGYTDGPLSDAGRIQMISILSAHTRPSYGVVIDEFPFMLKPAANEQVGLNRFGVPSPTNLQAFMSMLTQIANADRQTWGGKNVSTVIPLIIDGAFTRYDSSHTRSKGYGRNAGYRGDVEDEESLAVDFGKSGSERSVTLVVNIIDPKTNVVVGTEGFDLKFYSNSKTARFRVAVDEYYYGFSNTDVRVETVHAAQQILLEAGAIWILDNAFGSIVDFSLCFDTEEKLALGQDARYERFKAEQLALRTNPQTAGATSDISLTIGTGAGQLAKAIPLARSISKGVKSTAQAAIDSAKRTPTKKLVWQVRVGAFAKAENIKEMSRILNNRGYTTHTTSVRVKSGEATRIWIGPYADKKTAQEVCTSLAKLIGEPGGYVVAAIK